MSICAEDAAPPGVALRRFWLPKAGNAPAECEDAHAADAGLRRLAVADGASDSYDSGRWARLLATAFVDVAPPAHAEGLGRWVAELAGCWRAALDFEHLPWNQQAKAQHGAHCTFLGVELDLAEHADAAPGAPCGGWRAIAVGDACLFQVRQGRLLRAFPLERADQFGLTPALLATSPAYRGPGLEQLAQAAGELRVGDALVLATDALARWLLAADGAGERPWERLPDDDSAFAALIDVERRAGRLRNDDVTLLRWVCAAEAPPEPAPTRALARKRDSDRWLALGRV